MWRARSQLANPVAAGAQRHAERDHVFLAISADGVTGWGEISPQPAALNGDPGIDEVIEEIVGPVRQRLGDVVERIGALPAWGGVQALRGDRAASGWAWALVEMALLDGALRHAGEDLTTRWGVRGTEETVVTVSLIDDAPWDEGRAAARVRAKVRPGPIAPDVLERLAERGLPTLLDFNATAHDEDEVLRVWERVAAVVSVVAVEQPFAPGQVAAHARLVSRGVPVSLDEGVRSTHDVRQIARYGAASMVCVKPARVGGLARARSIIHESRQFGLRVYVGGFFETELARGASRALARSACDQPSDVAPVTWSDASLVVPEPGGLGWRPADHLTPWAQWG